jgi:hypothetical protein
MVLTNFSPCLFPRSKVVPALHQISSCPHKPVSTIFKKTTKYITSASELLYHKGPRAQHHKCPIVNLYASYDTNCKVLVVPASLQTSDKVEDTETIIALG